MVTQLALTSARLHKIAQWQHVCFAAPIISGETKLSLKILIVGLSCNVSRVQLMAAPVLFSPPICFVALWEIQNKKLLDVKVP